MSVGAGLLALAALVVASANFFYYSTLNAISSGVGVFG